MMRKVIFVVVLFIILSNAVLAEEIALVVKNAQEFGISTDSIEHEKAIKNILETEGFVVTLIDATNYNTFDYSTFDAIIIAGRSGSDTGLGSFVDQLPLNQHKSMAIDVSVPNKHGWVSGLTQISTSTYNNQQINFKTTNHLITNGFSNTTVLQNITGKRIIAIKKAGTNLLPLADVIGAASPSSLIYVADEGTVLSNGVTTTDRIVFFGIVSSRYWTTDSKQLFKNSLEWLLYGYDSDGDGVRDGSDNCVDIQNPDQLDSNANGIGDVCDNSGPVVELLVPSDGATVLAKIDSSKTISFSFTVSDDNTMNLECALFTNIYDNVNNPNKDFIQMGNAVTVISGNTASIISEPITRNDSIIWNVKCSDGEKLASASNNFTVLMNFVQCVTTNDCSANNQPKIYTCNNNPDNNPYTWDLRLSFTSKCNETSNRCTIGGTGITHTCDKLKCGAECASDNDCAQTNCAHLNGCVGSDYYDYGININNTCLSCSCTQNACAQPVITLHDPRCGCNTDADCSDGLWCNGAEKCSNNVCSAGTAPLNCAANNLPVINSCSNTPDNNPFTLDVAAGFTSVCNETAHACTTSSYSFTHTCNKQNCSAECTSNSDCGSACTVLSKCYDGTFRNYTDNVPGTCSGCACSGKESCTNFVTKVTDADNDSFDIECDNDCDDNNAARNPGASEICDGIDNDCDQIVDEGFLDFDKDGLADCIDPDKDNDGVLNANDNIIGNSSNLNSTGVTFKVNSVYDPTTFNGTGIVDFVKDGKVVVEFSYDFSNTNQLDLSAITIQINSESGKGSILIRGITLPTGQTKSVYVNRILANDKLCIFDEDVTEISVRKDCTNGIKLTCPGTNGDYTCTLIEGSTRYIVTGLSHSAATEYSYTAKTSSGGGGGGGGGGGSALASTDNWICDEWSSCVNGIQTQICRENSATITNKRGCTSTESPAANTPAQSTPVVRDMNQNTGSTDSTGSENEASASVTQNVAEGVDETQQSTESSQKATKGISAITGAAVNWIEGIGLGVAGLTTKTLIFIITLVLMIGALVMLVVGYNYNHVKTMPRETHYTSEIKRMLEEKEKQKALAHTAHTSTAAHTKTTSTAKTAGTKAVHTEHIEAKKATATEAVSKHESVSKLSENKPSEAKSQPATDRHSSIANRFSNAKTPLGSYISAYLNSDKPKKAKPESKANSESSNASNAKTDAKKKESSLPEHGIITSSSRTKARNRYIGKSF